MSVPFTRESSIYDLGVGLVLWMAAFETLANDGNRRNEWNNLKEALSSIPIKDPKQPFYFSFDQRDWRTCPYVKLADKLRVLRNNFAHGNEINQNDLVQKVIFEFKDTKKRDKNTYEPEDGLFIGYFAPILFAQLLIHITGYTDCLKKIQKKTPII